MKVTAVKVCGSLMRSQISRKIIHVLLWANFTLPQVDNVVTAWCKVLLIRTLERHCMGRTPHYPLSNILYCYIYICRFLCEF